MKTKIAQVLRFGRDGDAREFQAYGWAHPEDGYTWTDGYSAALVLDRPEAPNGFFIEMDFWVNGGADGKGAQRMNIIVNGHIVGQSIAYGRARMAWRSKALPSTDRHLVIIFELPNSTKPAHGKDNRTLGIAAISLRIMLQTEPASNFFSRSSAIPPAEDTQSAIALAEQKTGLGIQELAMRIESLGVNCEPGFFQRKCGAEPLSLLRFSGVILHSLIASIDDSFSGIGNPQSIDPVPDEADLKDWIIYERTHFLRYHTWVGIHSASVEEMRKREAKRLPFLRNKLLEDMENGEKLFVHLHDRVIPDAELWPLFLAIRRRGPGCVLFIVRVDANHEPGAVEEIYPGLMRGFFSHFSSANIARDLSMPQWLAVCTNALMLKRF